MGFIKKWQNFETATLRIEKLAWRILTTKFGTVVKQNVVQNMKDGSWGYPESHRITIINIIYHNCHDLKSECFSFVILIRSRIRSQIASPLSFQIFQIQTDAEFSYIIKQKDGRKRQSLLLNTGQIGRPNGPKSPSLSSAPVISPLAIY